MDTVQMITDLMRLDYEALGFLSRQAVQEYVDQRQYCLIENQHGAHIGYLLHGPIRTGHALAIVQHCVELDQRDRGYGAQTFAVLRSQAEQLGASSIRLRCAVDLPALDFWRAQGFQIAEILPGGQRRQRQIAKMILRLDSPLWDGA